METTTVVSVERPDTRARADGAYPWALSVVLFVAAFLAYELKRVFGLFAHQVFHLGGTAHEAFLGLGTPELITLGVVVLGLAVYQHTGLPNAPWLERLIYRDKARPKEIRIWRPALIAVAVTLGVAIVLSIVGRLLAPHTENLFSTLHSPSLPRATMIRLWSLYPLAVIGAPIDEEIHYRLGLVSIAVFVLALAAPRANRRGVLLLWIPIVLVGILFGYDHVTENLETVQTGNIYLSVLIAPQTWAGIIFGYVFCTWGLEAAIVTHFVSDVLAPLALALVTLATHLIH